MLTENILCQSAKLGFPFICFTLCSFNLMHLVFSLWHFHFLEELKQLQRWPEEKVLSELQMWSPSFSVWQLMKTDEAQTQHQNEEAKWFRAALTWLLVSISATADLLGLSHTTISEERMSACRCWPCPSLYDRSLPLLMAQMVSWTRLSDVLSFEICDQELRVSKNKRYETKSSTLGSNRRLWRWLQPQRWKDQKWD